MTVRLSILLFMCAHLLHGETLSFDECVRETSEHNRDLLAQKSAVITAEYQLKSTYSYFFPHLSADLNVSYGNQSAANGWTVAPSIAMRHNVFAGYADEARVELAKANVEIAKADLAALKAKVSADLKIAFAALIYAQDALKLSQNIKERRSFNHKLVSLLFEGGRENYGSVLLAKAYIEQADFQIQQAKNALRTSSIQLAKMLGRDPVEGLRAKEAPPLTLPENNPDFSVLAFSVPDYLKAVAQEKGALAQKVAARAPFFPTVDLISSANLNANPNGTNSQWLVGISVSWEFFSGGRDYYTLKGATQAVTTAHLAKSAILSADTSALAIAYSNFTEAIAQLHVDEAFLTALTAQEKIAREDYNNGFLNFQNWDQIETAFVAKQQAILVSQRNRVNTEAAWQLAKGFGVIP